MGQTRSHSQHAHGYAPGVFESHDPKDASVNLRDKLLKSSSSLKEAEGKVASAADDIAGGGTCAVDIDAAEYVLEWVRPSMKVLVAVDVVVRFLQSFGFLPPGAVRVSFGASFSVANDPQSVALSLPFCFFCYLQLSPCIYPRQQGQG